MADNIQVIWENSNDGCDSNRFHNLLLICSCFESCLVSTSDSPSPITSTTIDYTEYDKIALSFSGDKFETVSALAETITEGVEEDYGK